MLLLLCRELRRWLRGALVPLHTARPCSTLLDPARPCSTLLDPLTPLDPARPSTTLLLLFLILRPPSARLAIPAF